MDTNGKGVKSLGLAPEPAAGEETRDRAKGNCQPRKTGSCPESSSVILRRRKKTGNGDKEENILVMQTLEVSRGDLCFAYES